MGSGHSKPDEIKPRRSVHQFIRGNGEQHRADMQTISRPIGGIEMVPAPERDSRGIPMRYREYDLTRATIIAALDHVGDYIHHHGEHVTIVAIGGAISTIHLQTRRSTHDVDFFCAENQTSLLRDASKHAQSQNGLPLGMNWFNNTITLSIGQVLIDELIKDAKRQNVVVMKRQGLIIYAAPWMYALCGKTDRMYRLRENNRPYDCSDAVSYLHEYIKAHGGEPVPVLTIMQWAEHYRKNVGIEDLHRINKLYQRNHKADGIIL